MVHVRKVIMLNRSLCVVMPKACAKHVGIERGSYVMIKNVKLRNSQGILIEKLPTEMNGGEFENSKG